MQMEIITVVCILTLIFLLGALWKYFIIAPIRQVDGGYCYDVILPHTDQIEFYFADISACSMKVRMCLASANVKFKPHAMKLPSAGSWETKSPEFLHINPAGTLPVLVHNGHPIYESSEQMWYIANNLIRYNNISLIPEDSENKKVNEYWVAKTSWHSPELSEDLPTALKRRVGNCLPIISIPSFAAIVSTLSWSSVLKGILILGCCDKQAFNMLFSFLGVHAFKLLSKLADIVRSGKVELLNHMKELEEHLKDKKTKYICGDTISLADIGWAPILERLTFVDWWDHIDITEFPHVQKYWQNVREEASYKEATRLVLVDKKFPLHIKAKLREWKGRYSWFKNLYE